jgi:hypothetical protein
MNSTAAAVDIVKTFPPMKTLIDGLPPLLNGLVMGTSTKSDCQVAGREAAATQSKAYESIQSYFSVTHPPYDQADTVQNFYGVMLKISQFVQTCQLLK